uniref:OBP13 n=1 Tax=Corythucha ciliata TaxID=369451 RepID=A0A3G2YV55_CORCT
METRTKWRLCYILLAITLINIVTASQEIMVNLSKSFRAKLIECQKELNIPDHIMQDFYNFWKEEYELVNKELGCAIICIASKHDLMSEDRMHHGKATEFAKKHGADDDTAKQIVNLIQECEKGFEAERDFCVKALEVAKCFRTRIHELKWAPTIEMVLEEVISEVQE